MNRNVCTDGQETDMPKEVQNIQNKTRWFQQKNLEKKKVQYVNYVQLKFKISHICYHCAHFTILILHLTDITGHSALHT